MDRSSRLNPRQVEVLRWIADGCPDGVMSGFTHKKSAQSLQDRQLVVVSRRRGVWAATVTDAGRHYLRHGDYPADLKSRLTVKKKASARGIASAGASHRPGPDSAVQPEPLDTPAVHDAPATSGPSSAEARRSGVAS